MVRVRKPEVARKIISYHNIQQNTARIARTVVNVAVSRSFVRSV